MSYKSVDWKSMFYNEHALRLDQEFEIDWLNKQLESKKSMLKLYEEERKHFIKPRMHSRIRELVDEAGIAIGNNEAEGSRIDLLNKFAVLIIKECADIALREDHDPSDCILKHFGVER